MEKTEAQNNLAGAQGSIALNGRTFLVSPPTDADVRAIGMFLKKRSRSPVAAMENDPDFQLLDPDEQKKLRATKAKEKFTSSVPFDPMSAYDALTSVEGCRFMAWIVIRKKHPEMKLEDFVPLITEENVERVFIELDEQTGMASLGNSDGRPG